jgi:hypothetical protein
MANSSLSSRSGQAGGSSRPHGSASPSRHASPGIRVRTDSRAKVSEPSPRPSPGRNSGPLSSRERARVRATPPASATEPSPRPSPGGRGRNSGPPRERVRADSGAMLSWRSGAARPSDGRSSSGGGGSSAGEAGDSTRTNLPGATRTQVTFVGGSDAVLVLDRPRPLPRRFRVGSASAVAVGSGDGSAAVEATGSGVVRDGSPASIASEVQDSMRRTGGASPEGAEGRSARPIAAPSGARTIQAISRR